MEEARIRHEQRDSREQVVNLTALESKAIKEQTFMHSVEKYRAVEKMTKEPNISTEEELAIIRVPVSHNDDHVLHGQGSELGTTSFRTQELGPTSSRTQKLGSTSFRVHEQGPELGTTSFRTQELGSTSFRAQKLDTASFSTESEHNESQPGEG